MADPYPPHLRIDIDRSRLRKYIRVKWLLSWTIVLSIFGVMFGAGIVGRAFDQGIPSRSDVLMSVAIAVGVALAIPLLLGGASYLMFSHRLAARFADGLEVSVEGPFLRIRQRLIVETDRKLHFRAIVDYVVTQDPLMRLFDVHALQMTTTANGQSATISIPGVKECFQARDMLADIDRLREDSP